MVIIFQHKISPSYRKVYNFPELFRGNVELNNQ